MFSLDDWLVRNGMPTVDSTQRTRIQEWTQWYRGFVDSFHRYSIYNGITRVGMERKSLCMAKFVCEDWANLLLNERVQLSVDEDFQEPLNNILFSNSWFENANRLVELAFAQGTAALVEWLDETGAPRVEYYRADSISPITWQNHKITECAFSSMQVIDGKKVMYVMIHRKENGRYVIYNHLFDSVSGEELPLPDNVQPVVQTGSTIPLFQVFSPAIVNNADLDCPMGISVFANAIDTLEALDDIYDSYDNEFRLGRKRIMIPLSMARISMSTDSDSNGTPIMHPVFDPKDTVYYAFESAEQKPIEINMALRTQEHETALQNQLSLLSGKCGLGFDRYIWDKSGGAKTAKEVISDKSAVYQNMRKHELPLETALINMVNALAFLSGYPTPNCKVNFDDSIIEDSQSELDNAVVKLNNGLISKHTILTNVLDFTDDEADKELKRVAEESGTAAAGVDAFLGSGE